MCRRCQIHLSSIKITGGSTLKRIAVAGGLKDRKETFKAGHGCDINYLVAI
jgi:hypothetical protein